MNNQVKQRLFITAVFVALIWLMSAGILNLMSVDEIRTSKRNICIDQNIMSFDFCFREAESDVSPTFLNYISPFIPTLILLWLSWVFKLNFQIDIKVTSNKFRKIIVWLVYFVAFFGFIFPFIIVFDKDLERIYEVLFYNLFLTPWLAICWISIPIFFQKLLDSEKRISEFTNLYIVVYVVAASPILSIISLLIRQELKI